MTQTDLHTQSLALEQWYWHTLYFMNRQEATKAKEYIRQHIDHCCDMKPATWPTSQYSVEFSTNYPFSATRQQGLKEAIGSYYGFETSFNQLGDDEELLDVFRWPALQESHEVSAKTRTRIADGRCTDCGMHSRLSRSLWCAECKRAHLQGLMEDQLPDEALELEPFCILELGLRIIACLLFAMLLCLIAMPLLLLLLLDGLFAHALMRLLDD